MTTLSRKFRFTQRELDRLPPCPADVKSKSYECSDADVIGLRIAVNKAGRKFWFWRYSFEGRKRAARIGEYPATDLATARKRASEMRAMLDLGKDVQAEKDWLKKMPTFQEFAENEYMPLSKMTKRSHKDDIHRIKHLMKHLAHRKLGKISTREVQGIINGLAKTHSHATANLVLALISRMMKLATIWGIIEKNPCYGIQKFKLRPMPVKTLKPAEIARLFQALDEDVHYYGAQAIKLMLLTGLRRNEALRAKWSQIDFDNGIMHLPETKAGKHQHVVISTEARAVLDNLRSKGKSQWLFPGKCRDDEIPVFAVDACMRRSLARAALPPMRVHDCRHVYASLLAQHGVSLYVIQSCLRHQSPQMTMVYAHLCDDARRDANRVIDRLVGQAVSEATAEPVVQMSEGA